MAVLPLLGRDPVSTKISQHKNVSLAVFLPISIFVWVKKQICICITGPGCCRHCLLFPTILVSILSSYRLHSNITFHFITFHFITFHYVITKNLVLIHKSVYPLKRINVSFIHSFIHLIHKQSAVLTDKTLFPDTLSILWFIFLNGRRGI